MGEPEPVIGDVVGYVLASGPNSGEVRPAIIVVVVDGETVNLQVFTDGDGSQHNDQLPCPLWVVGARRDVDGMKPGTWHHIYIALAADAAFTEFVETTGKDIGQ